MLVADDNRPVGAALGDYERTVGFVAADFLDPALPARQRQFLSRRRDDRNVPASPMPHATDDSAVGPAIGDQGLAVRITTVDLLYLRHWKNDLADVLEDLGESPGVRTEVNEGLPLFGLSSRLSVRLDE